MQLDLAFLHHGVVMDDGDGQVPSLVQETQRQEDVVAIFKIGISAGGIPMQNYEVKVGGKTAYLTEYGMYAVLGEAAVDLACVVTKKSFVQRAHGWIVSNEQDALAYGV